jgi:hypothetical protein
MWWSKRVRRQNALHAGLVRLHKRKHTPKPVHPPPHPQTQKYVIFIFHGENAFAKGLERYVIRALPVLCILGPEIINIKSFLMEILILTESEWP